MIHPYIHLMMLHAFHSAAMEVHRQQAEAERFRAKVELQHAEMQRQREVCDLERMWRMSQ